MRHTYQLYLEHIRVSYEACDFGTLSTKLGPVGGFGILDHIMTRTIVHFRYVSETFSAWVGQEEF